MKKNCLRSVVCICLLMAGMGMVNISCSKDEEDKEYISGPLPSVSSLGEFVSFIENGQGVMNHDTLMLVRDYWFIEVAENERYYVIPMTGETQTELKSVSKAGTKVQFSGKLYNFSEEYLSYKDDPDMKSAKVFAELANKYKIYYLVLPNELDSDYQKCYIKQKK